MTGPDGRGRGRTRVRLFAARDLSWQDDALCAVAEDVFFSEQTSRAKAVCSLCPVWQPCLDYGMSEEHGVWGGLTRAERARLGRLRQRLQAGSGLDHPQNAKDADRLTQRAGLSIERLAAALGVGEAVVEALCDAAAAGEPGDVSGLELAS